MHQVAEVLDALPPAPPDALQLRVAQRLGEHDVGPHRHLLAGQVAEHVRPGVGRQHRLAGAHPALRCREDHPARVRVPLEGRDWRALVDLGALRGDHVAPCPGQLRRVDQAHVRLPPGSAHVGRARNPGAQLVRADQLDPGDPHPVDQGDLLEQPLLVLRRGGDPQEPRVLVVAVQVEVADELLEEGDRAVRVLVGLPGPGPPEAHGGQGVHHPDLGHAEAGVATAGAVPDELGLQDRDPHGRLGAVQEVRGRQAGVAAADDRDVDVEVPDQRGAGGVRGGGVPEARGSDRHASSIRPGRGSFRGGGRVGSGPVGGRVSGRPCRAGGSRRAGAGPWCGSPGRRVVPAGRSRGAGRPGGSSGRPPRAGSGRAGRGCRWPPATR